jgi:glycosyltransferase involved in cell wall biosynthesis
LLIVGAEPAPAVRALAAQPGVAVTGNVPDVRPYVRQAAATVVPLAIARGTQNKILESMAMGVPVIASTLAANGVHAVPGRHLLTADTPAATAEHALRLMADPVARARFAAAAHGLVQQRYAWPVTLADLDTALADVGAEVAASAAMDEVRN